MSNIHEQLSQWIKEELDSIGVEKAVLSDQTHLGINELADFLAERLLASEEHFSTVC
jgi:hypothetical protein